VSSHRLTVTEKIGYSGGDAAANFVFMTMILFQTNFYTDTFGLSANVAAAILLWPKLWDAVFDPIMGIWADRTHTRWGKFRPWILWTAVPWAVMMVLAYSTPRGWSGTSLIIYATVTNLMLMTLYSMNNMPYSALGGVMTSNLNERAKLNSYRFVAVNVAQFMVGGLTLPLVAKFSQGHDRAHGWQMTMSLWAGLCLALFLTTFFTTRERVQVAVESNAPPKQDFKDLLRNRPWRVMAAMTLIHFAILSFRGGASYNYYHQYVDREAMFLFLESIGLTAGRMAEDRTLAGGILEWLGYVVDGERKDLAASNVADVFNSIVNMVGTLTTILVIMLSASFARRFGKKEVAVVGFGLSAICAFAFYLLRPVDVGWMIALTVLGSAVYAPTVPLLWAIFADVADLSELQTGRRFTGMVFATIGFCLKAGLALGQASFLWIMAGIFGYNTRLPGAPEAVAGYRVSVSVIVGMMFAACTVLLARYHLNKRATLEMAEQLARRRALVLEPTRST
jgi:GPH family glycoside/pentoside/hexuronide:cation symporter